MAIIVYTLCALTSAVSAGLLLNAYFGTRYRLLLWSSICFTILAVNNVFLVLDKLVFVDVDLSIWRNATALLAISILLYGMIVENE